MGFNYHKLAVSQDFFFETTYKKKVIVKSNMTENIDRKFNRCRLIELSCRLLAIFDMV